MNQDLGYVITITTTTRAAKWRQKKSQIKAQHTCVKMYWYVSQYAKKLYKTPTMRWQGLSGDRSLGSQRCSKGRWGGGGVSSARLQLQSQLRTAADRPARDGQHGGSWLTSPAWTHSRWWQWKENLWTDQKMFLQVFWTAEAKSEPEVTFYFFFLIIFSTRGK